MEFIDDSRPSPIVGTWYPGNPSVLKEHVSQFIAEAKINDEDFQGEPAGIIVPHAGHRYSGKTAGYAYKALKGTKPKIIVIVSPCHQHQYGDVITTKFMYYQTPLGKIPVATKELSQLQQLLHEKNIHLEQVKDDPEHAIEIQLPFLQEVYSHEYQIMPIMIRTRDPKIMKTLAHCISQTIKPKKSIVIASTDLSHFYALDIAEQLDAEMLRRIKANDPEKVLSAETEGKAAACGASAIATVQWTLSELGATNTFILNYSTSADTTGDESSVVGYGSALITGQP